MNTQRALDELIREDSFLRRLAHSLLRDPEQAEDAVQDAWVLALQRGGQGVASVPRWLSGCVRNLARQGQRGDRHRRDRESYAARDEAVGSTADLVARESVRRKVVEAVLELPGAYRETVLELWFEGRKPKEWARELNVSVETIRTRRRRALELLRKRLDDDHDGDRTAWSAMLLPLTQASGIGTGLGSRAAEWWILSTQARWAFLLVAAVVLAGAVWWIPGLAPSSIGGVEPTGPGLLAEGIGGSMESASAEGESSDGENIRAVRGAGSAPGPEDTGSPNPVPDEFRTELVLRLSWASTGAPAQGIGLSITPTFGSNQAFRAQEYRTDPRGVVQAFDLEVGRHAVTLDRGDHREEIELLPGQRITRELELPAGYTLVGTVVDLEGEPVPHADILLYDWNPLDRGFEVTTADAEGRFSIPDCSGNQMVGAVGRHHAPSLRQLVHGSAGDDVPVTLVLRGQAGQLGGEVIDPDGQPVVGARVSLGHGGHLGTLMSRSGEHGITSAPRFTRTDAEGQFHWEGVATGRQPLFVRTGSLAPWSGVVEVDPDVEEFISIQLYRGCILEGTARGDAGESLPNVLVEVGYSGLELYSTTSDATGKFRLEGLPSGEHTAKARVEHGRPIEASLSLTPSEPTRWDPIVSGALGEPLRGVVVDHQGAPLAQWTVALTVGVEGDRARRSGKATTDRQGRFELTSFHRGVHTLDISPPETFHPVHRVAGVEPDGEELRIVVPKGQLPSIRIRGHVLDATGKPASGVRIHAWLEGFHGARVETLESGESRFDLGPYPPGVWRIDLTSDGSPQLRLAPERLGPGEVWDCGTLELGEGGTVRVQLTGEPALVSSEPHVQVRQHGKPLWVLLDPSSEGFDSHALSPGDYEACLESPGIAYDAQAFRIREGKHERVELSVRPGKRRVLHLDLAEPEFAQLDLTLSIYEEGGRRVLHQHVYTAGPPPFDHEIWLAPGLYRIEANSPGGQASVLEIEVAGEPSPDEAIDVILR